MARQQPPPTTKAIMGYKTIFERTLTLLLSGEGYDVKVLQTSPTDLPERALDGVDLLLLAPSLSSGVRDVLLSVVRGNPRTAAMPALTLSKVTLSKAAGEVPDERSVPVPWTIPIRLSAWGRRTILRGFNIGAAILR